MNGINLDQMLAYARSHQRPQERLQLRVPVVPVTWEAGMEEPLSTGVGVKLGNTARPPHMLLTNTKTNTRKAGVLRFQETKMFYWVPSMRPTPPASAFGQDKEDGFLLPLRVGGWGSAGFPQRTGQQGCPLTTAVEKQS